MKKIAALFLALLMAMSLVACGGASDESIGKGDDIMAKVQVLYDDTKTELAKTDNTGYDDVQEFHDTSKAALDELKTGLDELRTIWNENKNSASQEEIDDVLNQFATIETTLQTMKDAVVAQVEAIGGAIDDAEAEAEDDIAFYEVPEMANTTWYISGAEINGQEMTDEQYQALLDSLGGNNYLVFNDKGEFQQQQETADGDALLAQGTYSVSEDKSVLTLEAETSQSIVFTQSTDGELLMVIPADETTALYYSQK